MEGDVRSRGTPLRKPENRTRLETIPYPTRMPFQSPDFAAVAARLFDMTKSLFGTDSPIDIAVRIAVAYLLVVWLATVIWTVRDVTNRTGNILVQVFAILLIVLLTPILGLPLYLLIRPQTTLTEKFYEDVGLAEVETGNCEACGGEIREGQRFCPHCGTELLAVCPDCGAPKEPEWKFCPDCGSDGNPKSSKSEKTPREEKRTSKKAARHPEPQERVPEPETAHQEASEDTDADAEI